MSQFRTAVDISSNNSTIDFADLKKNGVDTVFVKVTEGVSYVDPGWPDKVHAAKAQGLKVGLYHFARPDLGHAPEDEAEHFWASFKQYKDLATEGYVLDIEQGGNVGPWSLRFLLRLGRYVPVESEGMYFSPGWWEGAVGTTPSDLKVYWIWLADYFNDGSPNHQPPIPSPWTEKDLRWFQYTDHGHIGKYVGDEDRGENFPQGGWLMALTDAEQQDLYDKIKHLYNWATNVPSPDLAKAIAEILKDHQSADVSAPSTTRTQ
jgi:hypothetical protein